MDSEIVGSIEKHSESEISSMANSGKSNRDVPAPFTSVVDSAIETGTAENLDSFRSFVSAVDNAIRSSSGAYLETPRRFPMHGFASGVDSVMSSATGEVEDLQLFTLAQLVAATKDFSRKNQVGAGSFGLVYKGKLADGRKVAIKRGTETGSKMKELQEILFGFSLAFMHGLRHKHLVGLSGFCKEKDEKLLVYEYMKNGALNVHLHHDTGSSSVLNSWKMRIKIALDASRGIQYLHNYADPSIIHGDIKSSDILLDATSTAKVSDFGWTFMNDTIGTVGCIDPEYNDLNELTTKSDVYGLGVVLIELLTGKTPIFKNEEDGGTPLSVVDFAVPAIMAGDLVKILDPRVGPPNVNEAEALELLAHTAIHCVNSKGKDRPTMADIVVNLVTALDICDSSTYDHISGDTVLVSTIYGSHDSISSGTIPVSAIYDSSQDSGTIPGVLLTKKKKKIFCCFKMI